MTPDLDERLGNLLREGAPPGRDPLFRIRVLERREREQYRLRSRLLFVGAATVALIHVLAFILSPNVIAAGLGALLCLAVIVAGAFSVRGALQALRWLRGS
jgi:hypothetical protein